MRRRVGGWLDFLRSLGQALLEVLRAELTALSEDLRLSARRLRAALLLFLAALLVLFWGLGVLVYAAVEVLALWLPRWGAALSLAGLLLLVAGLCAGLGRGRLRGVENPARTVRRRLDEHVGWWQRRVLDAAPADDEPEEGPG